MTYCFRCPTCGSTCESSEYQEDGLWCAVCLVERDEEVLMVRDWRAEGARVNTASLRTTTGRGIT